MSTTTEQNKAIIRRFFDAWNSRQPEAFDLIAPDVVRHCEATPGVEARSLQQVKEFLRQDTAIFPDSVQMIKLLSLKGTTSLHGLLMRAHSKDRWGHFHPQAARRNSISEQCSASKAERSQSGG
jgi:hypothetical protein